MTTNVEDVVRRAFDDIIDAAGDLGPCPTLDDNVTVQRTPNADRRGQSWTPVRAETSGARRWVAFAAALLIVVGVGSVALVARTTGRSNVDGWCGRSRTGRAVRGWFDREKDHPPLFVINDASTGIAVLDAHSTHLECILVPNTGDTDDAARMPDPEVGFIDPCHGSLFDRAGNKLAGPAARSMDSYRVTIADQRVWADLPNRSPAMRRRLRSTQVKTST